MATPTTDPVFHEGVKIFPPFDFAGTLHTQLLWLTITFGIFYLLVSRIILPRIGSILELRSSRIAQDLDEASRLQQQSTAAHSAYESELSDAKSRASSIAHDAKERARLELESKREELVSQFAAELSRSESRIKDAKDLALLNLSEIASPTAKLILSQVFRRDVSIDDVNSAISSSTSSPTSSDS